MLQQIWLLPAIPFISFLILALFGNRLSKTLTAFIGAGSIGLAAIIDIIITSQFMAHTPAGGAYTVSLWQWMNVAGFNPSISFQVDSLALVFTFVITFVGFLIHVYSTGYMKEEEGYSRFFAYMNLFVGSMLTLVLADNLLLMYLGWEGVGLCSFLLIGFFYRDSANGHAAQKAFIVTRVGDTAMMIGLLLLFMHFNTLNIADIMQLAQTQWAVGSTIAVIVALLLLGGAVGKSAQLPLQTWLPDAMAGPSPVSALIHAATMVTAGVYLIARTNVLFTLAPIAQTTVAIIGAATLLIAGFSALSQYDLKRVLAYSTISQIGYMFLALGVGAWSAAVFHFMIHAFFKALLFLGGGAVILALHHEQNMFKMGGLRKELPLIFWTFVIGSCALAALPLVSAGFYSKDLILWYAWSAANGSKYLWLAGFVGAFLTSIYTFRMVFLTFFGEQKTHVHHKPGLSMTIPLIVLAILSVFGGFIELPESWGHVQLMSGFLSTTFPETIVNHSLPEWVLQLLSGGISILGIYIAYIAFYKRKALDTSVSPSGINKFFLSGFGFDRLYDVLLVKPYTWICQVNKNDFLDKVFNSIGSAALFINKKVSSTQNGQLNWYLMSVAFGVVILLTLMMIL
jgi:NADH-quinone oxidoreductase subunit L